MSARTRCPECLGARVEEAKELFAPNVDFFQCHDCHALWHLDKGQDDPPSQELLGKAFAGADSYVTSVRR
jgi:hypothetical protein